MIQMLDYEHVPFRCHKFHEHGHIFYHFQFIFPKLSKKKEATKDGDGFTKIPSKRKYTKNPMHQKKQATGNIFEVPAALQKSLKEPTSNSTPRNQETHVPSMDRPGNLILSKFQHHPPY